MLRVFPRYWALRFLGSDDSFYGMLCWTPPDYYIVPVIQGIVYRPPKIKVILPLYKANVQDLGHFIS
jgi:hypothetical protein